MKKLLFLTVISMMIYSCNDSFEEVDSISSEAGSANQEDYNRGFSAGKDDAKDLIDDTFYESECSELLLFQVKNENDLCYYTSPSQLAVMNDFIVDYNANLDALISSSLGATRAFHTGVKEGFNLEVCAFGYKYGYASFCAFIGEGSGTGPGEGPDGPDGPGGPGGPGGEEPIDTGCGNQLICG